MRATNRRKRKSDSHAIALLYSSMLSVRTLNCTLTKWIVRPRWRHLAA